jgi:hypothetical protein
MLLKRLVCKNSSRADFSKVATEFIFKDTIFMPTKINVAPGCKCVEVFTPGIVFVKPNTTVALDTSVHLMVDERTKILISVRSLLELKSAVSVARHYRHVLQVAGSPFVAYCTIMRMISHQPFDDMFTKLYCFVVLYRDPLIVCHRFHTGHYQSAFLIILIFVNLYGTLATRAHRSQRRVPAEIWQVEAQGKASFQKILSWFYFVRFVVNI